VIRIGNVEIDMKNEQNEHVDSISRASNLRQPAGWLWVSAGILAGLIVAQGGGFFESTAQAEMATSSGSYSLMTTDGGNDEILVVVDSRQESLMVYRTFNKNEIRMLEREELSGLFSRARARAMGRP
tara:strand:+ start:427326 stop:427706 length:381 start_codon:yes stop_codon:yes gene_type:complete